MAVIKNVETRWVNHTEADSYGNLTLTAILDSEQELDMVDAGLPIKTKDGECFYKFSYPPQTKGGKAVTIDVRDRFGKLFEGRVPNGTRMDIDYYTYQWEFNGRTGVKGRIKEAKILGDVISDSALEYDTAPEENV